MSDLESNMQTLNELSLRDVLLVIKRYQRLILLVPIVVAILAAIIVFFVISPKWEASAVLQVGQVGQADQVGVVLVEPPSYVVARIKHPSFARLVLSQLSFSGVDKRNIKDLFKDSLTVIMPKGDSYIEFRVQGYSPEMAFALASAVVSNLQLVHGKLMTPSVTGIKAEMQSAEDNIKVLKLETDALQKQLSEKHDWDSYNATLSALSLQDKGKEVRDWEQRRLLLAQQLSTSQTFNTKTIGEIYVSEKPVAPKKLLIIVLATLLGLFGSLFFVFIHNSLREA